MIYSVYGTCSLQLVELKEAEQKSLKESERLEKEVAEVQEMKVLVNNSIKTIFCPSVLFLTARHFLPRKRLAP